ncbi:MAG: hypothetical protein H7123_07115, partial [Thermoleophilia bacterium]|nr:hypothetical protein [Thermoleophilia bacterium]
MLTFLAGRRRLAAAAVTLAASVIALTSYASAAPAVLNLTPGSLDTTFSADGIAKPNITNSSLMSAVSLVDGSTVALGTRGDLTLVEKYTPSGELDTTFGGGDGKVTFRPVEYSFRARFLEGENHIYLVTDGTFRVTRTATIATNAFVFGSTRQQLQPVTYMTAVTKLGTTGGIDTTFGDKGTFLMRDQHVFDANFIASSTVTPGGSTVFARVRGNGPAVDVTRV